MEVEVNKYTSFKDFPCTNCTPQTAQNLPGIDGAVVTTVLGALVVLDFVVGFEVGVVIAVVVAVAVVAEVVIVVVAAEEVVGDVLVEAVVLVCCVLIKVADGDVAGGIVGVTVNGIMCER